MIRWLLDTDHLSLHERGHIPLRSRLVSVPAGSLAVSVVTVEETLRGRLAILARRAEGEARVRAYAKLVESVLFFGSILVVPFDLACERRFQTLRSMQLRVGSQDLRIAATALENNLIVVTRNRQDFERVPGLLIEDWSQQ